MSNTSSTQQLSDSEFQNLKDLIYQHAGIVLTERKRMLLITRLSKALQTHNLSSFDEYYQLLKKDNNGSLVSELIDAISTNHTFFLREKSHFDFLQQSVLPEWRSKLESQGNKDLRIWCAAASSGEEPYCLAMIMMEYFGGDYSQWKAGLLATDISREILGVAQEGIYDGKQLEPLPKQWRQKYFKQLGSDPVFQASSALKREITYRRFNLTSKPYQFKKPFHIVFCRNVMIYFDNETIEQVVEQIYQSLEVGGYLFIGHSESLSRIKSRFEYVQPAVYQKTSN